MATVTAFQTRMDPNTTVQEAVEHAVTHEAEEKANQTTHHDDVSLRLHLGDVLSHATVDYAALHCTCALSAPWSTFEVAAHSTLSLSCGCCCHGF